MMEDYQMIKILIEKNEFFYKKKHITKIEFIKNSLFLASRMEAMLKDEHKIIIKQFSSDEFSLIKFKLAIGNLKAVIN